MKSVKLLVKAGAIFDRLNDFLVWVAIVLIIFVWIGNCIDVVMRYFLNNPIAWMFEASEHTLVFLAFLGAAWLLGRDGHVRIDFVVKRFEPSVRIIINSIACIFCAIVSLFLTWYGGLVVLDQFQRGLHFVSLSHPLMWPLYIVIPIGSFLLFIQSLRKTYQCVAGRKALQIAKEGGAAISSI